MKNINVVLAEQLYYRIDDIAITFLEDEEYNAFENELNEALDNFQRNIPVNKLSMFRDIKDTINALMSYTQTFFYLKGFKDALMIERLYTDTHPK